MGSAGFGYDIGFIDDSGKLNYVEVKATSSKDNTISFSLSGAEFEFAQEHMDSYILYFVSDVKGFPKVFKLEDLFVDGRFNTAKYCVEPEVGYEINATAVPVSETVIK